MKRGLLVLFFGIVLLCPFVLGATINVPGDYTTIQSAIDAASAGDVIEVGAGTYVEDLTIDETKTNLELSGAGRDVTTIKGVSNIYKTSWPTAAPNIEILSDGVSIHGFTIESPDYVADYYTSGIVIGEGDVEIYDNNFIINSAETTDEISQIIQTYSSISMPSVDISGLNIHHNTFTHKGGGDWGYEAIYINPDGETSIIYIKDNDFGGKVLRAITSERSKISIENNNIITDLPILPDGWVSAGAFQGINIRKTGSQTQITIRNNIIKGFDITKGFKEGIRLGQIGQIFSEVLVENNILNYNEKAILVMVANGISINYNEVIGNTIFGVENKDTFLLDAENNYWGSCDGPSGAGVGSGDAVSINVDYTPWLGACIDSKTQTPSCVLETDNVILSTTITSLVCVGDVLFEIKIGDGEWTNYSYTNNIGDVYSYLLSSSLLEAGETILWTVYADDCYGHITKNGEESFYVNSKTSLSVNPVNPNGLGIWYVTEPLFTLTNPDATNIYYQWDSTGALIYSSSFDLDDTPNNGNVTAGILELNWWSDICAEPEQSQMFYIDLANPQITDVYPEEDDLISTLTPIISASLSDPYQSNSGIDETTISLDIDGENIIGFDFIDGILTYPANLNEGFHTITINVADNAGNVFQKIWSFRINVEDINLQILNPLEGNLNERRQRLYITTNEIVEKIEYQDEEDTKPRWKRLCRNCNGYNKLNTFKEGQHTIIVKATTYAGLEFTEDVSFFIDSIKPKIISQTPSRGYSNGNFIVKYTEENPVQVILHYEQDDIWEQEIKYDCVGGRLETCEFYLTGLSQEELTYYFEIIDISGFSERYRRDSTVMIDTIPPNMAVDSPQSIEYSSRKIPFDIVLNEEADIYYIDNLDKIPRWKRIASNREEYKRTRTFRTGSHEVIFKAVDDAGNEVIIGPINFEVNY